MSRTALGVSFLTHVDFGNHNAGEGGSQLSDLKKVGNRPYISGQAYRHGIKEALRRVVEDPDAVDCTPRYACGEIETCKLCDLFGYMNTDLGDDDPPEKRLSPLRVSPLVGQYEQPIASDMILQYDEADDADNRIGYREMTENVFHGGIMIDVPAVGRRESSTVDGDRENTDVYQRSFDEKIGASEQAKRVAELLEAIKHTSQLAGQARHMADFMPDFVVGTAQDQYNQRIMNAIRVEADTGEVNTNVLESVLADLANAGADIYAAGTYNPEVMANWEAVISVCEENDAVTVVDSVSGAIDELRPADGPSA
jgi:CRISPR-associated protein Cas7/Cst2/DevR subtype I-B